MRDMAVTILVAVFFGGCNDAKVEEYSRDGGMELVSEPSRNNSSVSRLRIYRVDGFSSPLQTVVELERRATIKHIVENAHSAAQFVGKIRSAAIGEEYQRPGSSGLRVLATWHIIIHFEDPKKAPAYWILERCVMGDKTFDRLIYQPFEGWWRDLPSLNLEILQEE